jgi:hypothetical protein
MNKSHPSAEMKMLERELNASGLGDGLTFRRIEKVKPDDRKPIVYFLSAAGANLIKIGHVAREENLGKRIALLQPGCPYPLVHVFSLESSGRIEEARLHKLFADQAFHGEWFRCDGALKEFLQYAVAFPEEATQKMLCRLRC